MASGIEYLNQLHCGMPVTDLDRSVDWYTTVLGFRVRERLDQIGLAILETPVEGTVVGLTVREHVEHGGPNLTWGVADIDAARAALEAHGVALDGSIQVFPGVVKLQGFFDPDGNAMMFWAEPDPA